MASTLRMVQAQSCFPIALWGSLCPTELVQVSEKEQKLVCALQVCESQHPAKAQYCSVKCATLGLQLNSISTSVQKSDDAR